MGIISIYIVFDKDSLFDGIRDAATERDLAAVYDSGGHLLADAAFLGSPDLRELGTLDLRKMPGQYRPVVLGGEKYSLIATEASLSGILLAYATPNVILFEDMASLRLTTTIITFLAVLLTAIVSLVLGYLNYRPLARLLHKVRLGRPALEIRNELLALDYYISDTLRENQQYKKINAYTEATLRQMFLEKLLLFPLEPDYLTGNIKRFGLMENAAAMQVALLQLPAQQDAQAGERLAAPVEALAGKAGIRVQHVPVDQLIVFIFQFSGHQDTRFVLGLLDQAFAPMEAFKPVFYISDMVTDWQSLPSAYRHALSMYEYAQRTGWRDSLFYEELAENGPRRYRYTTAEEQKLLYAIRSGDEQAAHHLAGEIIDRNSAHFINETETRCLTSELCTTLLKVVKMIGPQAGEAEINELMAQVAAIGSVFDSRGEIEILIAELCAYYHSPPETQNDDLLRRIEALIEKNIWNHNFNVSSIAESLGMSLSFISKFYKDKTNEKLVDHLMNLRVKRALQLLAECDDTVEEIALRCGFANIRTFNRVFLSVTGITPLKYRKFIVPGE